MTSSPQSVEFVTLWSVHSRRVYAYIYSLVANWSDADDIFQETSVVLMQKFDEFQPGTSFFAWACKVAYHKVLVHYKKRRSHEHLDDEVLALLERDAQSLAGQANQRSSALADCMALLAEKDRKLIELRYHGESTVESIAENLGRTPWAVYKALARVHESLLNCIRRKLAEGDAV